MPYLAEAFESRCAIILSGEICIRFHSISEDANMPTKLTQPTRDAWVKFLSGLGAYAFTTIHFNWSFSDPRDTEANRRRSMNFAREKISKLAWQLDSRYFNTPHVADRVAMSDRFEGICIAEKVTTSLHLHIVWYLPGNQEMVEGTAEHRFSKFEECRRTAFLIEQLNSNPVSMDVDKEILEIFGSQHHVEKTFAKQMTRSGWSVHTTSISDLHGLADYLSKEAKHFDFSGQTIFVSDFHCVGQRVKPTRYHTIDPKTGALRLDLDQPLRPRQ